MGIITWLVVGLIAGWLAGQVMRGDGYGVIGDILLGLIGAVVGGWLFGLVMPFSEPNGLVGSVIVATIGAIVFIALARALGGGRAVQV